MLGKRVLGVVALVAGIANGQDDDIPTNKRLDVVFGPRAIHAPGALMHPGRKSCVALGTSTLANVEQTCPTYQMSALQHGAPQHPEWS
jgi:hypothetical protein